MHAPHSPFVILAAVVLVMLPLACQQQNILQANNDPTHHDPVESDDRFRVPQGFAINEYADVPQARSMVLGEQGTLFVGSRAGDRVVAVRDLDGDDYAEDVITIASGLNSPNGVAFKDGDLYIAEISRIQKLTNIENRLDNPPAPQLVFDGYPTDTHHGWKYIAFGPDGHLYVPVGAPCNICDEPDPYASITRLNAAMNDYTVVARGVRNTVGFDWDPVTGDLWFTDNGRDWLGDNLPPDELNRADQPGMHFGYPYRHGSDVIDPDYGDEMPDDLEWTAPARELGPHVAALGMVFYDGDMFPAEYHNQIFIAEHGSWNRSEKIGYRVRLVRHDGETGTSYEDFAIGWLEPDGDVIGRPVDVIVLPDGSMLVSDDHAGKIYRITYHG